jgi:hypothetical protein
MAICKCDNAVGQVPKRGGNADEQCIDALPNHGRKGCFDFAFVAGIQYNELQPELLGGCLHVFHVIGGIRIVRIDEHRDRSSLGHQLMQRLELF